MSDRMRMPQVELRGSLILIMQKSEHQEQSVLTIPADSVDEFCESIYWVRKQYLTSLNDASLSEEARSRITSDPLAAERQL